MLRLAALACALALVPLAGCSSVRPYPDDLAAKNLTIRTRTSSGSMFSSVRAALGVHSVGAQCRSEYLGTVELDKPSVAVGIPAGRWTYLVFDFSSSGLLAGRTRMSQDILLKPAPKRRYEIDVTYQDDIYHVVLRETLPRGASRELPLRDPASRALGCS